MTDQKPQAFVNPFAGATGTQFVFGSGFSASAKPATTITFDFSAAEKKAKESDQIKFKQIAKPEGDNKTEQPATEKLAEEKNVVIYTFKKGSVSEDGTKEKDEWVKQQELMNIFVVKEGSAQLFVAEFDIATNENGETHTLKKQPIKMKLDEIRAVKVQGKKGIQVGGFNYACLVVKTEGGKTVQQADARQYYVKCSEEFEAKLKELGVKIE